MLFGRDLVNDAGAGQRAVSRVPGLLPVPGLEAHLWRGKGQGSASYAFSSKSRRSLCPDSLWTPHRRFSLSPTLLINVHVESDGLPGSIKGDVKREHFTSSSVRISFGIQPLIAARCCRFWRLAIQRNPDHTTFVAITITSRAVVGCRTWRRTESEIAERDHRWGRCRQPSPGDRS